MEGHISKLCQSCFFQLRRLRSIRHSLSRHALLTLVHAFISSRLDFCNSALYGVSGYLLNRQSYSIHFECCGKTCSESLEVRSHLWCFAERATLAPYCATNQLQDLPSRAQLSGGYSLLVQFTYPSFVTRWAPRLEGVIFVLLLDHAVIWSSLDTAWNAMVDEASQLWGRICGIYFPWMYEIMRSDWTFSKRS